LQKEETFEKTMDMENIRHVLEDAAQTFLSAANTITNERRREAEKVIKNFELNIFSLQSIFSFLRFFYNFVDHNFPLIYIVI
jgi:hypothetical protein